MTEHEFLQLNTAESLDFLNQHKHLKPDEFALKFASRSDLPIRAIAEQIACYKKAEKKFPTLHNQNLIYTKRAFEQASSEATAHLKRFYLKGESIADLTGGLGIDSLFFSEFVHSVTYCERDPLLAKIASSNFDKLDKSITVVSSDGLNFLRKQKDLAFSWIYVDPDRRDAVSRKISIAEYEPNIIEHEALLLQKAPQVMVKVSPMVDLTSLRLALKSLDEFVVVSVDNECKEVWLILRSVKKFADVQIKALCYNSSTKQTFHIEKDLFQKFEKSVSLMPKAYFIEPDKAIIKARLTDKLAKKHQLEFLNENCDYLTSSMLLTGIPARAFKVDTVLPFKKKTVQSYLKANQITRASIARRNFPDSPEFLRKQFKLKEGGNHALFFTTNSKNELITILTSRL